MNPISLLSKDDFGHLVSIAPLISIDLIVENESGAILLGERLNKPAQGYWFVPGGRVFKNEKLDVAFERITSEELGCAYARQNAQFLGVFEHLYADSCFGENLADPSTHYVVLGYLIKLAQADLPNLPQAQHSSYEWWSKKEALNSQVVHHHTKWYLEVI